MLYCIWCGKNIEENDNFCCHCGEKIQKEVNYKKYYNSKQYIITLNELKLYKILLEIAKNLNLILLCQVSLYNIIESKNKYDGYFNKIKSKSIDFVLVKENNCKIELCIELDDKTHQYKNRIERDLFINKLFEQLNIKLLRIKSSKDYDEKKLKQTILKYIE